MVVKNIKFPIEFFQCHTHRYILSTTAQCTDLYSSVYKLIKAASSKIFPQFILELQTILTLNVKAMQYLSTCFSIYMVTTTKTSTNKINFPTINRLSAIYFCYNI